MNEYIEEDAIICVAEFDFYTEVLTWSTEKDELATALENEAWSYYYDSAITEARFNYCNALRGERFLTKIELDGPVVVVKIYDAWHRLTENELDLIDLAKAMSHREMAIVYRFADHGHPYFVHGTPVYEVFQKRWNEFGGMTPEISKSIAPLTS